MTPRFPVPIHDQTYLAESMTHGVGVYASNLIGAGQIIAEIPAIIEYKKPDDEDVSTEISDYAFEWEGWIIVPGGCIAFLNHSDTPNAEASFEEADDGRTWIILKSLETISIHTEVTINYGADYWESRS